MRARDSAELALLNDSGACVVQHEDVETLVSDWEKAHLASVNNKNAGWHEAYHQYDEMKDWYNAPRIPNDLRPSVFPPHPPPSRLSRALYTLLR